MPGLQHGFDRGSVIVITITNGIQVAEAQPGGQKNDQKDANDGNGFIIQKMIFVFSGNFLDVFSTSIQLQTP